MRGLAKHCCGEGGGGGREREGGGKQKGGDSWYDWKREMQKGENTRPHL